MSSEGHHGWSLLLLLATLCVSSGLKIASFNVQVFGVRKVADASVLNTIAKVRLRLESLHASVNIKIY